MAQRDVNFIIRAKDDASRAFNSINDALAKLAGIQAEVEGGSVKMGQALKRSSTSAEGLANNLSQDTERAARQVETAFQRISAAVEDSRQRMNAQQADLEESEAAYRALTAQLRSAREALEGFRNRIGPLQPEDVTRLRAAEQAVKALDVEVRRSEGAWTRQSVAVAQAREEFDRLESQAAVTRNAILQVSNTPLAPQNVEGAVGAQRRVAQSFREAAAAARPARASIRDVIRELTKMPPAADGAARAMQRGARGAFDMRNAMRAFYGDSRRALSLMQRIRGEVLSLTASFVGFYAVFQEGNRVFQSFRTLEQAQNRLGAAFGQNAQLVGQEISFLQGEAQRLGFSFESLSDNYSKFLISAQAANFETEETRAIFMSVIEAARVMNLSTDQVSGALTALTQIAGKGTVQMEELRQQLGDRIPGAVAIMAAGLGFAGDELDEFYKLVENGNVSAREGLVGFSEELNRRFGGQLQTALQSVTAEVGRFQDNLFNARLTAAGAGFIDGLTEALTELNVWLQSTEGTEFFEALGAAAGNFLRLIPMIVENLGLLGRLFQTLVAIKLAQTFANIASSMNGLTRNTVAARRAVVLLNRSFATYAPTLAVAASRSRAFSGALRSFRPVMISVAASARAMWIAIGGPIGLIVTAITFFASEVLFGLLTSVDDASEALTRHEDTLNKVRAAYIKAEGDIQRFREELTGVTTLDLELETRGLEEAARSAFTRIQGELSEVLSGVAFGTQQGVIPQQVFDDVQALTFGFVNGGIEADALERALLSLNETYADFLPDDQLQKLDELIDAWRENSEALEVAEAKQRLYNGTATEADEALLGLGEAAENAGRRIESASDRVGDFRSAMDELAKSIPSLKAQLDRFDSISKIETQFQNALTAARALPDAILRVSAAQEAFASRQQALDALEVAGLSSGFRSATSGSAAAEALLIQREGFSALPYNDPRTDGLGRQVGPDILRAGFGSDTITLADGSIRQITEGIRVSREDALRDLRRRIDEEFLPRARSQVGAARFDSFSAQQQGVLGSIAYNYGQLPERILDALRTGSNEQIASAIRALGGDNGGVNAGRRNQEAAIFASGEIGAEATAAAQTRLDDEADQARRAAEQQREFNEELAESIRQRELDTSLQNATLTQREIQLEIDRQIRAAREAGVELSEADLAAIEESVRANTAKRQSEEDRNQALERARRLEEEVNQLQERRRFLIEQQTALAGQGDLVGAARAQTELEEVNGALDDAISKAISFWKALGGEEAESAIRALQQTQAELQRVDNQVVTTGRQINDNIAEKGTQAFDSFSQAVANGQDPLRSLATAFQQMAGDILIELGAMIIRQSLFNALSGGGTAGGNAGAGGLIAGAINSIFHGGGIAGQTTPSRTVNPAIFANAARYHMGGIAGLRPDEVPAILQQGEEVLTANDPRHRGNMGGKSGMTIINTFDVEEAIERGLATPGGQDVLVNAVRSRSTEIKAALEE